MACLKLTTRTNFPALKVMKGGLSFQQKPCADAYLFGFNGQEKVNEMSGVGNHNTAEFWEYDTRLGRRWNMDPVVKPWRSSYDAFDNSPIWKIDPNGDDDNWVTSQKSGTVYDSDVKTQGNAEKYYGEGAKLLEYEKEYTSPEGNKFTLLGQGNYVLNGEKKLAVNQRYEGSNYEDRMSWLKKGDIAVGPGSSVNKAAYKLGAEWNPLSHGVANLGSSVTGKDMTIPAWNDLAKTSGNISGSSLSIGRRITTGVVGATQIGGILLGGGHAFGLDASLNAFGDFVNKYTGSENASPAIKITTNFYIMMTNARHKPIEAIGGGIGIMNTVTGEIDKKLKEDGK